MSGLRSDIIDVTYQQLHQTLCGENPEHVTTLEVKKWLEMRKGVLGQVTDIFGKPSDASKKQIESGSITLPDGVVMQVDGIEKDAALAVSSQFQIDQIQAFILMRSFFYNQGLSGNTDSPKEVLDELLESMKPFYNSERLSALRTLIPLFRSEGIEDDAYLKIASSFLPKIIPDGPKFVQSLLDEYVRKTKEILPSQLQYDPIAASTWGKQNLREQLVLIEVLFWTMWGYVPCSGPLVEAIFKTAYESGLGTMQANNTLLLDDEGLQLKADSAAMWILVTTEVLDLEGVSIPGAMEFSDAPSDTTIYHADPESLKRLHDIINSRSDGQFSPTFLAWTYVLLQLSIHAAKVDSLPASYQSFFNYINPPLPRSYSKDREPIHIQMAQACLDPSSGLFFVLQHLLTASPLFVTSAALRSGSSVTDSNPIAFRSVLKGLIMGLVDLVPVEQIPDFDGFVDIWIALFGRSESTSVAGICQQFWAGDWRVGISRRALIEVARSRFPIHVRPLVRLLRAMTGSGFMNTDPLYSAPTGAIGLSSDRRQCDEFVYWYMAHLDTYSTVVPVSACTGPHALYDKQSDRYGTSAPNPGLTYTNLRPLMLPGGVEVKPKTKGKLLSSDGGEHIVISWDIQHSGWKIILEILTNYVNQKKLQFSARAGHTDIAGNRRSDLPVTLSMDEIGMESDAEGDETIITDALDLIRSLIKDYPAKAKELLEALELSPSVVSHTAPHTPPPGLTQLTAAILEEALSRSNGQAKSPTTSKLITTAMSVLTSLLNVPMYSANVWLFVRSTNVLFPSDRSPAFSSAALAAERATGTYTMTLALIRLVQGFFVDAMSSIRKEERKEKLLQVKEEVLLRALKFVHTEIWVEHMGWKYARLGDRFEIGRRIVALYNYVFESSPPALDKEKRPFPLLSQTVADVWLFKATTSTINPLVIPISSGEQVLRMLYASRRSGEAFQLIQLLGTNLTLCHHVLNYKLKSDIAMKPCLLDQALCARVVGGASSHDRAHSRNDPIDVLSRFSYDRNAGSVVPLQSVRVLTLLGICLSSMQPSPPTIIGHLSDPEGVVSSLVRIIQHPYEDLAHRKAIWSFASFAVAKEPALATLFVSGKSSTPGTRGRELQDAKEEDERKKRKEAEAAVGLFSASSALEAATEIMLSWEELWDLNPLLLCSVMQFLDVVWQHALQHKTTLESLRKDAAFWEKLAGLSFKEVGPVPEFLGLDFADALDSSHSNFHDSIQMHSYRVTAKAHATRIITRDIGLHLQLRGSEVPLKKSMSYSKLEPLLKDADQLSDMLQEAAPSSYDPSRHDELARHLEVNFPEVTLEQLERQEPLGEREYGDAFSFSVTLLMSRVRAYDRSTEIREHPSMVEALLLLFSLNLNLSLVHAETVLMEAWEALLRQVIPYLRAEPSVRPTLLQVASDIAYAITLESRQGEMMASIHSARLSLLLSILELGWFSTEGSKAEVASFISLIRHVRSITLNEAQPPARSLLSNFPSPFHRVLLQIVFFCIKQSRSLLKRPKALNSEQRLVTSQLVETSLLLVVDSLRVVFVSARNRADIDLDRDMELLVSVFHQCTRADMHTPTTFWLARCQETDVIRASLELFVHIDLVGLSDLPLLLSRKQPLYAPHVLLFHVALATNPASAERLASEGILAAYSNNFISAAISAGQVDVVLPELPGQRSPAHLAYCYMISIVAGVIGALGRQNHYFDAEAAGFVQLYGEQISRTLSWTIGDSITLPFFEELDQTVNLFHAIASSAPSTAKTNPAVERVLRVFSMNGLKLLQQINYAISHPNHLASLYEGVTHDERVKLEKANSSQPDPLKRPFLTTLIHRLYKLSSTIVGTLVTISRAELVLLRGVEDWPIAEALIAPHSKVVLGEPASLGTLVELGNQTLDILRNLLQRPPGQSITEPSTTSGPYVKALGVQEGIVIARRNLEEILLYAVTQLAMWLSKPDFESVPPMDGMDMDELPGSGPMDTRLGPDNSVAKERERERRQARSSASTMAERLRRGMTGEMVADLQALLNKSKTVFASSDTVIGKPAIDLTPILLNFLHERIGSPS